MASGKSARQRKYILFTLSFLFLFIISFVLLFRKLRDALPPTEIGAQKIVGYAQYFGYPLSLDAMIFFLFISVPVIVAIVMKMKSKNR